MKAIVTVINDDGRILGQNKVIFPKESRELPFSTIYDFHFSVAVADTAKIRQHERMKADEIVYDEFVGDPEFEKHFKDKGGK